MPSTTVGSIQIDLVAGLAQFKDGMRQASDVANRETRSMSQNMKSNVTEARGTLALLGEDVGITIPRHLQTFIAHLPGVGTALSAAFSSVAVLAIIEVIVKAIAKIDEWRQHARDSANAWAAIGNDGTASMEKLHEELLQLQAQLDELNGDHLGALENQLKLINAQTLDKLVEQFDKVGKAADDAFTKMQVGWFESSVLNLGNDPGVKNVQQNFENLIKTIDQLKLAGNNTGIGKAISDEMNRVKSNLAVDTSWAGTDKTKPIIDALNAELSVLQSMAAQYKVINEQADIHKTIAKETAANAIQQEKDQMLGQMRGLTQKTDSTLGAESPAQKQIKDIQDLITKWQQFSEQYPQMYAIANARVQALETELTAKQANEEAIRIQLAQGFLTQDLAANESELNRVLQSKQDEAKKWLAEEQAGAEKEAQVLDKRYQNSVALYEQEYQLGKISEDKKLELTRAALDQWYADEVANQHRIQLLYGDGATQFAVAQQKIEEIKQQYIAQGMKLDLQEAKQFTDVYNNVTSQFSSTLNDMLTTGKANWSDFFASIERDMLSLIEKRLFQQLLGSLMPGGGTGGFGGFLSSLFGLGSTAGVASLSTSPVGSLSATPWDGTFADGGDVVPGGMYLVGERGPEPFIPSVPGTILPNDALVTSRAQQGKSAPAPVIVHFHGITDMNTFKASEAQVSAKLGHTIERARMRNG